MGAELSPERAAFLARDFSRGFPAYVGYAVLDVRFGRFETELVIEPRHTQQDGFVHAGVMATMLDHTMGYAAFSTIEPDFRILSVEFKLNFLRPATGEKLICRARIIKAGSRLIPIEGDVFSLHDGSERLVARGMGTMASVPASRIKPA